MSIAPPDLDSRTYDQLVAGAKQRIPRYLPEWTDFNESDPGIMLVELFAWMTEAVLYELNQAPTALQLKLLQMLGFDATPAQPATTELQFTLNPGIATAIVPALTKVQGQGLDGSTVIFETDRAVVAIYPPIYAALAVNGLTSAPFIIPQRPTSVPFAPFPTEVPAGELDALYIAFQYAGAFPNVDLDLAFFLEDAPGDSGSYTCNFGNPPVPPAAWVWEYCDSTGWRAANLLSDGTAALYRSGHVQMSFPTTPVTSAPFLTSGDPNLSQFNATPNLYWIRARLTSATYEQPPSVVAITTNTAPATAAQTITNEVVGASTGMASQQFSLANAPVLASTLELTIDEGLSGDNLWTQVQDFFGSSPEATVYTLDATTGEVTFGDNHYGAIPLANPNNPTNITATTYRYGGGSAGNIAANSQLSVVSYVASVASVTNPVAASGGSDQEPLSDAIMRAGADIRSTNRAVTADDFSSLALETPGALVARAQALPLTNPDFMGITVPGAVTVIVVPQRQVDDEPALQTPQTGPPIPNQTTLQAVCAWLDQHRLVTTELFVIGPTYHTLTFAITLYCSANSDLASVSQDVVTALRALYAPAGSGGGWPWGATAYAAVAFATAMNVSGVTRVASFTMYLDGTAIAPLGDATIGPNDLFWVPADGVGITPRYEGSA